jgi:HSP20 family protein
MASTSVAKQEEGRGVGTAERTRGGISFTPRVDIVETSDELLLLADIPGVLADDLDIRYEKGELVLHAKCSPRVSAGNMLLNEYAVGDFHRAFSISESIDASRIAAEVKNGVLTVHLPKTEKAKPKRISVKAS